MPRETPFGSAALEFNTSRRTLLQAIGSICGVGASLSAERLTAASPEVAGSIVIPQPELRDKILSGVATPSDWWPLRPGKSLSYDTIPGILYDVITIPRGGVLSTMSAAFFQDCGPGSTKTLAESNCYQSGRLPAPRQFSVNNLWLCLVRPGKDHPDTQQILENVAVSLVIGQKRYILQPAAFNMVHGDDPWHPNLQTSTFLPLVFGSEAAGNGILEGITIESQMLFGVYIEGRPIVVTNPEGLRMYCCLYGLDARGLC